MESNGFFTPTAQPFMEMIMYAERISKDDLQGTQTSSSLKGGSTAPGTAELRNVRNPFIVRSFHRQQQRTLEEYCPFGI
jgi:hypothetical protein